MTNIRIELSNDLHNWVSQINGVDIYYYSEATSFAIKKGYSYGGKHLTNTFSFTLSSRKDVSDTVQTYKYVRCRKDSTVVFVGVADETSASITVTEPGRLSTQMKYKDISSLFEDVVFTSPTVNPYDDDQIAIEISAEDGVEVCNPDDTAHSLVHILLNEMASSLGFTIEIDCPCAVAYTVQYFSAIIGDNILDVFSNVLKEAGLTYWCDTLTVHIVDLLAEKTVGTELVDIERQAKADVKSWISTEPPTITYPSLLERDNQRLWELGQRKDEFAGLYWTDGNNVASLTPPDTEDDKDTKMTPVGFFNLRVNISCSAKEIQVVNFQRQSFKNVSFNIDNTHRWAGLRVVHKLYNAFINGTVRFLVYDSKVLPSTTSEETVSCEYIYSEDMAKRYAKAFTVGRKMQQATWSFYADEDVPVDSLVRLEGVGLTPLRITAKQDNFSSFGGFTYTASPYSVDVPVQFTTAKSSAALTNSEVNVGLSLELTGNQFVYAADGTPITTDPITVWINGENIDGTPDLYVSGNKVDLYRDYAPDDKAEEDRVYTGRYYYLLYPYATAAEDNTIELTVQAGDQVAVATVYKVVNGSIAVSIEYVTNEYAVGNSATVAPTTGWSSAIPERAADQTLWVRDIYTYTDGHVETIGARPVTGDNGRGIKTIVSYYATTASGTEVPTSWSTTVTPVSASAPYLWSYSTTTYTDNTTATTTPAVIGSLGEKGDTGPQGQTGASGKDGAPAKAFSLFISSQIYSRNMRRTGNQPSIAITFQISGYTGTPSITVDHGTLSGELLAIPYQNDYDSITVTATLTGAPTQTVVLSVKDDTLRDIYWGALAESPDEVSNIVIDGDYYYDTTAERIKYRKDGAWVNIEDSGINDNVYSRCLSVAMSDILSLIDDDSTLSSYYGYFNRIIANKINATELTVEAANIKGKLQLSSIDGGNLSITNSGIGATSADGKSTWRINADGTSYFKNTTIDGTFEATKVIHPALTTLDEVAGKSIGTSAGDSLCDADQWSVDDLLAGLTQGYFANGNVYTGATINGKSISFASINRNPGGTTVSGISSNVSLVAGNTYKGSATIYAGDNKYVLGPLVNNYPFPVFVTASASLGGNMNYAWVNVYSGSTTYEYGPNVKVCLMPGESLAVRGKSWAWWGNRTAYGTIVCDISCQYPACGLSVHGLEGTFGEDEWDSRSFVGYELLQKLSFERPTRYLAISYYETMKDLFAKVNGSSLKHLNTVSSGNYFSIYDLGYEATSADIYYQPEYDSTREVQYLPGTIHEHTVTEYHYSQYTLKRCIYTPLRTIGKEPIAIYTTDGTEYRYNPEGYVGLYQTDVINSLWGYSSTPTRISGRKAYDTIVAGLAVGKGLYSLSTASSITISSSTLSALRFISIASDRIEFRTADDTLTLHTSGDTETELVSSYSAVNGMLSLLSSTLSVETTDIYPKENNTYVIGSQYKRYADMQTMEAHILNNLYLRGSTFGVGEPVSLQTFTNWSTGEKSLKFSWDKFTYIVIKASWSNNSSSNELVTVIPTCAIVADNTTGNGTPGYTLWSNDRYTRIRFKTNGSLYCSDIHNLFIREIWGIN